MVELRQRHVVQEDVGLAAVVGDAHAAVPAEQQVARVGRVDPHGVEVHVDARRAGGPERAAGIVRHEQLHAEDVDPVIVLRVDPDLAEVHRPRVRVAHLLPRRAPVVGPVDAAVIGVLDPRVEDVRVLAVDVEPDPSRRALGQARGQLRPALAGVGRLVDRAARPAAVEAPRRAPPLVGRRVQDLVVRRIHEEVGGTGVLVHLQQEIPGVAAVRRPVDAPLAAGRPQAAERRRVDDVVIHRVDDDARDVVGILEPHVRPALPAIGRLEDALTPRRALTVVVLACADPDDARVGRRNRDVADRRGGLVVEHRLEGGPVVGRLPETARRRRDIKGGGVALQDGEVVDPASHRGRADLAEA